MYGKCFVISAFCFDKAFCSEMFKRESFGSINKLVSIELPSLQMLELELEVEAAHFLKKELGNLLERNVSAQT